MTNAVSVLVVEDEALIRMDVVDQLEREGFRVFEAANADQAIIVLDAQSSVRIMFTDIDMPGSMDGLKLAAAVRDRFPPVQIIVTSGHRMVEIGEMPDGSVFFGKPYLHTVPLWRRCSRCSAGPGRARLQHHAIEHRPEVNAGA